MILDAPDALHEGEEAWATATISDRTGVSALRLILEDPSGTEVRSLAAEESTGLSRTLSAPLASLPVGTWVLVASGEDVSGKSVRTTRALVVERPERFSRRASPALIPRLQFGLLGAEATTPVP